MLFGTLLFSLFLQFSTSSFIFKNTFNIPSADLNKISYFLESEYNKLKEKWNIRQEKKIEIFFCATTDDFVWKTKSNRRTGAVYTGNKIYLQPLKFLKQRNILYDVLRHELIHAVMVGGNNKQMPKWFHEAFAIYESGEQKRIKKKVSLKFNSLAELESFSNSANYNIMETSYYYLGITMQYLITEYGEKSISSVITDRNLSFEESLFMATGESFPTFEKKIIKHLSGY